MTDTREIAEKIAQAHTGGPYFRVERVAKLADAVDEALRNERERCAKIADTHADHVGDCGRRIAAAIRNPKENEDDPEIQNS